MPCGSSIDTTANVVMIYRVIANSRLAYVVCSASVILFILPSPLFALPKYKIQIVDLSALATLLSFVPSQVSRYGRDQVPDKLIHQPASSAYFAAMAYFDQ